MKAIALALALAAPTWAWPAFWGTQPAASTAPGAVEAHRFEQALEDALASGDWKRVAPFFPRPDTGALSFSRGLWRELRRRELDPAGWDVSFAPYYVHGLRMGGRLTITLHVQGGEDRTARWDTELLQRAGGWVVGDDMPANKPEVHVTAHRLAVDLTAAGKLSGVDTLTLTRDGPDRRLLLALAPDLVVTDVKASDAAVPFTQQGDHVYVETPDAGAITLHYAGKLKTKTPYTLDSSLAWYPKTLDGRGASFSLTVIMPPGWLPVAAGKIGRSDKPTTFHWETQGAIADEALYAGRYDRVDSQTGEPRLIAMLAPGSDPAIGVALLEAARASATFYAKHYGAYPYPDLTLVQTSATDLAGASSVLPLPDYALSSRDAAFAAVDRGVARAWVSRAKVIGSPAIQRFMTDGVADYLALLHAAERDGAPYFRGGLGGALRTLYPEGPKPAARRDAAATSPEDEAEEKLAPLVVIAPKPVPTPTPNPAVQARQLAEDERKREDARNLLILHMLRKQVGNAAFDEAFRTLYANPASPPIDLGRFKHVFELTSGKHLDFFFGQWLGNDHAPSFSLEDVTVTPRSKTLFEVSGNVVQPLPAYYLTLPIVVRTTSHNVLYNLPIRSTRTFFHLAVHQPPQELLVDPLHDVLAAPVAVEDLSAR